MNWSVGSPNVHRWSRAGSWVESWRYVSKLKGGLMIADRKLTRSQMIHEWKNTLCVHSKYKEDLVHIRDMHRLLSYKGESSLLI